MAVVDAAAAAIKPKRERAAPRDLEGPVVTAVAELLSLHPRVVWSGRFNSGAAGEFSHIKFHWFVRAPEKMRMPDFFGLILAPVSGTKWFTREIGCTVITVPIAIECKAPGFTVPRDDREREQAAFLKMVRNAGGIGLFCTDVSQVAAALA